MKPPTNEPTMPSTIVPTTPIGSGPGTSRRASAPAIKPMMISEMMSPTTVVPPRIGVASLLGEIPVPSRRPNGLSGVRVAQRSREPDRRSRRPRSAADAHPAERPGTVSGLLPLQVERTDAGPPGAGLLVERVGRHEPRDLELDAVRILGVQGLRRAVVGCADQRASRGQLACECVQVVEGVDLPGQMVEPGGAAWR